MGDGLLPMTGSVCHFLMCLLHLQIPYGQCWTQFNHLAVFRLEGGLLQSWGKRGLDGLDGWTGGSEDEWVDRGTEYMKEKSRRKEGSGDI